MRLYRYNKAAQELAKENALELLPFYKKAYDELIVENARLKRELADNAELARRANDMADQQSAGIDALIGDLQITTFERIDGDSI